MSEDSAETEGAPRVLHTGPGSTSSVMVLPIGKTDAEKAIEYKQRITEAAMACCAIINEAKRDELIVNFQISPDMYGRHVVGLVQVMKALA